MNIRKEKGVTMVALVVTIIVLSILTGVSITASIGRHKDAEDTAKIVELEIIQHTILERYTKSQLTGETLPGTSFESQEALNQEIEQINTNTENQKIRLKGTNYEDYKILDKETLKKLGISNVQDTYIVNYKTGEVINKTRKTTKGGNVLYISK